MQRAVRRPGSASLSQLMVMNLIKEEDFNVDGTLNSPLRRRAETEFDSAPPGQVESQPGLNRPDGVDPSTASISVEIDRTQSCCVCLSNPRTHVIVPCFHLCVCKMCGSKLDRCPICRCAKNTTQRIFQC